MTSRGRHRRPLGLALALASLSTTSGALATSRRVVVSASEDDALAARIEKELGAMGIAAVRVDDAEGCSYGAVERRARGANAGAATCSDRNGTGVWVTDGSGLRLKDVVVPGPSETAAVRAAEIARASLDAAEESEAAARAKPPRAPSTTASASVPVEGETPPASPGDTNRAPTFAIGAGLSTLLGTDASVAALDVEAAVGIGRFVTIAPRLDFPLESNTHADVRVRPGFAGIAAVLPFADPSVRVVPRVGAGVGAAWIHARTEPELASVRRTDGSVASVPRLTGGTDITWSPTAYATAALSVRIAGPVRLVAEGVIGTTADRLVVRTAGVDRAYWGTPFGVLAGRMELVFR